MTSGLPRSTPSAEQVASRGIEAFLDAMDAAPDIQLHSLMIVRHGSVVAEGWWSPYEPDQIHLLYSLSKSFTATACGLAVEEGLFSLEDPVVSFFPEHDDVSTHPWTRALTVRDLAAMATGHQVDTLERAVRLEPTNVVRGFLRIPPDTAPGSLFCYNNGASYTLAAIVQRAAGQRLTDYLRPRLLDPLGIGATYWDRFDTDTEIGFSGLHLRTEDIARFGELYLRRGVWGGEAVLPADWVKAATTRQTDNPAEPNPDWQQGYGYQFWMSRHGYRGDGAYGQFCLVLEDQDAVVALTSDTENMQSVLDAAWAHLLPAFTTDGAAPDDGDPARADDERLAERLNRLEITPSTAGNLRPVEEAEANVPVGVWLSATDITDEADGWQLSLLDHATLFAVHVGDGRWARSEIAVGPDRWLPVAANGGWIDDDRFIAELILVQTPHRLRIQLDRRTGSSAVAWTTVPLRTPSVLGLAPTGSGPTAGRPTCSAG